MQNIMESTKVILVKDWVPLKANSNQSTEGLKKKKSIWDLPLRMIEGLRQNFGKSKSPLIFLEQ